MCFLPCQRNTHARGMNMKAQQKGDSLQSRRRARKTTAERMKSLLQLLKDNKLGLKGDTAGRESNTYKGQRYKRAWHGVKLHTVQQSLRPWPMWERGLRC